MRKLLFALVVALLPLPAVAGGWAVVTLDRMPTEVMAGRDVSIGFTVLQHGERPIAGQQATLIATREGGGAPVSVEARDEGAPGHYAAQLTLPEAGLWSWSIQTFGATHPMPPIRVAAAAPTVQRPASAPPLSTSLGAWSWALLPAGLLLAGLSLAGLRRQLAL